MTVAENTRQDTLDPAVSHVLAAVSLSPDGTGVRLGDREVTADRPRRLCQRLGTALYEVFHAGHAFGDKPGILHRDPALEAPLARSVPHATTPVAARLLDGPAGEDPAPGGPVAVVGGVRVRLPEAALPELSGGASGAGESVLRIPSARPRLSPGFFLVDGSRGSCGPGPLVRLYIHLTDPGAAVRVWSAVLGVLEELEVPYRSKVTSSRKLLPRRDGLVVYLGAAAWHAVPAVVRTASAADVGTETSVFARALAPGVSLAWEPDDDRPGREGGSFGQHRSLAIAEGIVDAMADGDLSRAHSHVLTRLTESGIDPSALHRNIDSPELPFSC
ncbi:T3SS effector HopA1 family protein [Streptomyces sp. NPDC012403]|uniref:T3SS effector HopA1 family protein n=1 Tax=Streptomyces sp. NPDC012403 TaxID=3364831 RepID=UPI0036E7528C